jgi:uridine kinase
MSIDELNEIVRHGEMDEFIRVCEARQCKALSKIADKIAARGGVRLVLLAGPSSSGKTTTAKRLGTQLRVNGARAVHFSTDDYFVGDARNPRDENGELDYETIEAVDRRRLAQDLNALLRGEAVHVRRFDFARHEGYDAEAPLSVPPDGLIILEGIHALNPLLTAEVPDAVKFRLYIEPTTQPMVFARTRLPSADARLLRRLVRDNQFRKMSPLETFRLWPKVLAGEAKWIAPFKERADALFDSSLAYELGVLKPYAAGLLTLVMRRRPEETKARALWDLLSLVETVSPLPVPGDSILRETIGSSQLDY